MLKYNFKNIESLHYGKLIVQEIRRGSLLIWEAVKSCFGSGFWINTKGWINKESWKNNK